MTRCKLVYCVALRLCPGGTNYLQWDFDVADGKFHTMQLDVEEDGLDGPHGRVTLTVDPGQVLCMYRSGVEIVL